MPRGAHKLGRMTDYVVGPGGTAPPEVTDIDMHAMILGAEPLLVLATRYALTHIGPYGQLISGDGISDRMRDLGAQPMTHLDFPGGPTPGWHAVRTTRPDHLLVTGPGGLTIYDGTLGSNDQWTQMARTVAAAPGLVLIVVSAADQDGILDAISTGRATWLRVPTQLS